MISKDGQPLEKKSSLGRVSPHQQRQGHAVTMEEVVDADDHLHRATSSPPAAMGNVPKEEVSSEWYTYTGNDAQNHRDPSAASLKKPSPAPKNGSEAAVQTAAPQDLDADQETPKPTPRLENHDLHGAKLDISSAPAEMTSGAPTREMPPPPPWSAADQQKNDVNPTPLEAAKSTGPSSPNVRQFPPHQPGPHPPGNMPPWQHQQPMYRGPASPQAAQFVPNFSSPAPTRRPAGLGCELPPRPPLAPGNHVVRLEPLVMSGYELLASRLAGSSESGPPIPPLYRRFKELNHRVLLGLQDELCCLEELLQNLDNADSYNRRYRDGILPASRRHDSMEPTEVTTARKGLVDQIAYKLYQYNTQLSVFEKTIEFKYPRPDDVHDYRAFLAATAPVVPVEMRFLDKGADLLCLPDTPFDSGEEIASGNTTPVERTERLLEAPAAPSIAGVSDRYGPPPSRVEMARRPRRLGSAAVRSMALAIFMSFFLPILSFPVIAGFASRMTVVGLVALATGVVSVQSGIYQTVATRASGVEGAIVVAVYAGFMAIVAGTFG